MNFEDAFCYETEPKSTIQNSSRKQVLPKLPQDLQENPHAETLLNGCGDVFRTSSSIYDGNFEKIFNSF